MTPLTYYQKKLASGEILEDTQQLAVMQRFEIIYQALTTHKNFLTRFKKKSLPAGIYLWGNVGIGKTFLVDTFFYSLPFAEKLRIHFHAFMRQLHGDLHHCEGIKNPLQHIADQWAKRARVLCFDEFVVNDIADALLLAKLLTALLDRGVCLIITSNFAPDDLYPNGLQRELFLPAIEKIKSQMEVIQLAVIDDYRINSAKENKYYWYPLTSHVEQHLQQYFNQFSKGEVFTLEPLTILQRKINVKKRTSDVVWFDFRDICGIPRSQEDYLVIVQQFHTILVSNVMAIGAHEYDRARTFISFVDVLYDAKVRLIISAAQPIEQLYTQGLLLFEFNRTRSRLLQMQSGM